MGKFIFSYNVPWVDTDALGIVHFSNYLRLCERTEQELFNSLNLGKEEIFLPRVHAECDYSYPLKFNQKAKVIMHIKEIGRRHITFDYEIWNDDEDRLSAHCKIVVVPVDGNMNPVNLNENIIKKLGEFLDSQKK